VDRYELSDGTQVGIRSIGPDDHDRLRAHHARLSPETRYRRFLASKPELTKADTHYLVDVDGTDHFALVATLPEEPGEPIIAVARAIRIPTLPHVAEFAIVVADDYQRQGLAGELMRRLAREAVARGITRFQATMLADNLAIRRLTESLASGPARRWTEGTVAEMEIDLAAAQDADVVPFPLVAAVSEDDGEPPAMIAAAGR
jgi:RimJ/RimL family protein N-acetyltransferase